MIQSVKGFLYHFLLHYRIDLIVFFLFFFSRVFFLSNDIDSWDAVDFALALERFDLFSYRPHFPGYPVYIAFAKVFSFLGFSDVTALSLPGLFSFSFGMVCLRRVLSCVTKQKYSGVFAVCLLFALPGICLMSLRPVSDMTGLGLLVASVSFAFFAKSKEVLLKNRTYFAFFSGFFLGLTFGARLSYFPFLFSLFFLFIKEKHLRKYVFGGFCISILIWLLPLLYFVGVSEFFHEGLRFTKGHFTRWGGAIGSETSVSDRALQFFWGFWAYHLGGLWPGDETFFFRLLSSCAAIVCLLGALFEVTFRKRTLFLFILPYMLWVFFGQNPESPRHLLPIILWVGVLAACRLQQWSLVLALGFLPTALSLMIVSSTTTVPQVALTKWVQENYPSETRFYGWKTTRLFEYYAPEYKSKLAFSMKDMNEQLQKEPNSYPVIFSSKLKQKQRRLRCFRVRKTFRTNRYISPDYWTLTLFEDCGLPR